jgi:hypothetical protein
MEHQWFDQTYINSIKSFTAIAQEDYQFTRDHLVNATKILNELTSVRRN